MKIFFATLVLFAVYFCSGARAEAEGSLSSYQQHQNSVDVSAVRFVREAEKKSRTKSAKKGKKKSAKKGKGKKKSTKKGKTTSVRKGKGRKGKKSAKKGKRKSLRKGKGKKGKKSAKKGKKKSAKKGKGRKKSAKKGKGKKKTAKKGKGKKKSAKKGKGKKKSAKKGKGKKKSAKKGKGKKNSTKKGKGKKKSAKKGKGNKKTAKKGKGKRKSAKIGREKKKSAKKGRGKKWTKERRRNSAKKGSKINGSGRNSDCFEDMVAKTKKFNRYQNEYRKLSRVERWITLSQGKKDKASTTFNNAISAMTSQTLNGTFCTNTSAETLAFANLAALKACPGTAEAMCDVKLTTAETASFNKCYEPLNNYVEAFKVCMGKSEDQCTCFADLDSLLLDSDCEDFQALNDKIKDAKEKCLNPKENGSFTYCRTMEREAAYVGPWCGCPCAGNTTATAAPSGRHIRREALFNRFRGLN